MIPKPTQPPQFYSSASATSTSKHPKELAEFFASEEYNRVVEKDWGRDEIGRKYSEFVGPHTKGMKFKYPLLPEKYLQLPDDVWVEDVIWDMSICFSPHPQCPGVPVYKLMRGESTRSFVWVGPDLKIIGPEFINWNENADLDAFSFLTEESDSDDE